MAGSGTGSGGSTPGGGATSRAGSRRAPRQRSRPSPALLGLAAAITALIVAWGYLVWAAIDFGTAARGGQAAAWAFLALASLGAVACLFAGLMLAVRLLRLLGLPSSGPAEDPTSPTPPTPPSPKGGKRAAR